MSEHMSETEEIRLDTKITPNKPPRKRKKSGSLTDQPADTTGPNSNMAEGGATEGTGIVSDQYKHLISLITDLKTDQKAIKDSIEKRLNKISKDLKEAIETKIQDVKKEIFGDMNQLKDKMQNLEAKIEAMDIPVNEFPIETTLVLINLREENGENIEEVCGKLVMEGLGIRGIRPVKCMRLQSNTNRPGIVKMRVKTLQEKKDILRAKQQLKDTREYQRVYIRSSQSHEERLIRMNMETILEELPNGSQYRMTGNGRVVRKDDHRDDWQQNRGHGRYNNRDERTHRRNNDYRDERRQRDQDERRDDNRNAGDRDHWHGAETRTRPLSPLRNGEKENQKHK